MPTVLWTGLVKPSKAAQKQLKLSPKFNHFSNYNLQSPGSRDGCIVTFALLFSLPSIVMPGTVVIRGWGLAHGHEKHWSLSCFCASFGPSWPRILACHTQVAPETQLQELPRLTSRSRRRGWTAAPARPCCPVCQQPQRQVARGVGRSAAFNTPRQRWGPSLCALS